MRERLRGGVGVRWIRFMRRRRAQWKYKVASHNEDKAQADHVVATMMKQDILSSAPSLAKDTTAGRSATPFREGCFGECEGGANASAAGGRGHSLDEFANTDQQS